MGRFGKVRFNIRVSIGLGGIGSAAGILAYMLHTHGHHGDAVATARVQTTVQTKAQSQVQTQVEPQTDSFSTRVGEHRCERLPDGILACANTNTTVRYTYDQHRRHVEVSSGGEVAFSDVTQDVNRPFDVDGGALTAGGLSGSFDVRRTRDSDQVTVIDGGVKVMPTASIGGAAGFAWAAAPTYHRRQQVEFDLTTNTLQIGRRLSESDLTQLMSWQRGRIDLHGLTLRQALNEFGRYQPISVFQYESESLAAIRMDGELEATNLMDFLITLERVYHIRYNITVGSDGNAVVKLSRQRARPGHPKEKPAAESKAVAGVAWRES